MTPTRIPDAEQDRAVEAMIADHMWLAHSLAQQWWRKAHFALDIEELRANAYLGLVTACRRWHPYCEENGFSPAATEYLKTFIVRRVNGCLVDALRANDWATRNLRARAKALRAAGQAEGLTYQELADRSGMSEPDVRATVQAMTRRPVSLEGEDVDPVATQDVESSVVVNLVLDTLVTALRTLPWDQQAVVALHYHDGLQLPQIAHAMGISESYASQLHTAAAVWLHTVMRDAMGDPR